jgi:hypothetical protein
MYIYPTIQTQNFDSCSTLFNSIAERSVVIFVVYTSRLHIVRVVYNDLLISLAILIVRRRNDRISASHCSEISAFGPPF